MNRREVIISLDIQLVKQSITEAIAKAFEQHGGCRCVSPGIYPVSGADGYGSKIINTVDMVGMRMSI